MCLLALFACEAASAAETKRVMLLQSYDGRIIQVWREYAEAIRKELNRQSPWPLEFDEHSIGTVRSSDDDPEVHFADYLGALYASRTPDLIVAVGGPAASFLQRRRQIFAATPALSTGLEHRFIRQSALTANDTVVAVAHDFSAIFANILRLLPDTKTVTVVTGNHPIERFWQEEIRQETKPFEDRVAIVWTNGLSFDALLKHAAALPPQSAIFWFSMAIDGAGVAYPGDDALTRVHAVATAPIFAWGDVSFGREIVGGPMHSIHELSQLAAAVAIRILGGEKAGDIRTPPLQFARPIFDWRQLQRFGISESRLPQGSEVRFRPMPVWQQYQWELIAIFAIMLMQATLIGGLLIERRRRLTAQMESRRRLAEVALMNRSATAGALSASIAHELNQPLGAILSNAEAAELLLAKHPLDMAQLKEILSDIRQADQRAGDIIKHMRALLKRSEIERKEICLGDLMESVLHILQPEAKKRGVAVSTDQVDRLLRVRADAVHFEQIILNLALNGMDAMAGSAPGTRNLAFQTAPRGNSAVEISIADAGSGIPADKLGAVFEPFYTTKQQGLGLGLSIVRTIVESYGGRIWAENRVGGGVVVRFTLPLAQAA
jgi:signal transduction histidine kinase